MMGTLLFISGGEIVVVLLVVVMLFGADKIPEIARGLGKGIKEVRNAANDIKQEINNSTSKNEDLNELKNQLKEGKKEMDNITGSIKRNMDI